MSKMRTTEGGPVDSPRTAPKRVPRGYLGVGHETIGSDILAVLQVSSLPEQVFGREAAATLRAIDPNGWYPIAMLLDLMQLIDTKLGPAALPQLGRKLFRLSHEARVKETARSAYDIVHGIDAMYHHANRGTGIGGWKVLAFAPGHAELAKTTPHHCRMEEGILLEALKTVGSPANVVQTSCFRRGADHCRYELTSSIVDARWTG